MHSREKKVRHIMATHTIDHEHRIKLLTLCGLGEDDDLPEQVQYAYWEYKIIHDRGYTGQQICSCAMIQIARATELVEPTVEEADPEESLLELWRDKDIRYGDMVAVRWRKKWVNAKFLAVSADGKQAKVQMENESEERMVETERIRVPEKQPSIA